MIWSEFINLTSIINFLTISSNFTMFIVAFDLVVALSPEPNLIELSTLDLVAKPLFAKPLFELFDSKILWSVANKSRHHRSDNSIAIDLAAT